MKNLYLFGIVVLFIVCVAIFVENVANSSQLYIFNSAKSFASGFFNRKGKYRTQARSGSYLPSSLTSW